MSAHKPKFNLEKVYLWQTIWSVFTNTGFTIALTEWLEQVEIKTQLSRYFTPKHPMAKLWLPKLASIIVYFGYKNYCKN